MVELQKITFSNYDILLIGKNALHFIGYEKETCFLANLFQHFHYYNFNLREQRTKHVLSKTLLVSISRGIAYLNDPDSYAGWSFYTPVRATQARQVEG